MPYLRIPSLAENVNEATLRTWLVNEGDTVAPGTPVAELMTEKAEFTLEADEDTAGTVLERLANEKSTLPVGFILAVVGGEADKDQVKTAMGENARLLSQLADESTVALDGGNIREALQARQSGVRATPAARRRARELGVELAHVAADRPLAGPVEEGDVQAWYDAHEGR